MEIWRNKVKQEFFGEVQQYVLNEIDKLDKKHFFTALNVRLRGCFFSNTSIQIDFFGNKLPIWLFTSDAMIWNPLLQRQMKVIRVVTGPEHGYGWIISTQQNHILQVTKSHPLFRYYPHNQTKELVFACNLLKDMWILTNQGPQLIKQIEKKTHLWIRKSLEY